MPERKHTGNGNGWYNEDCVSKNMKNWIYKWLSGNVMIAGNISWNKTLVSFISTLFLHLQEWFINLFLFSTYTTSFGEHRLRFRNTSEARSLYQNELGK